MDIGERFPKKKRGPFLFALYDSSCCRKFSLLPPSAPQPTHTKIKVEK